MTLYQFKALDEIEQIDDFYIELRGHIDSIGYNNIKTFRNPDLLTPYLEQIDITNIVELSSTNTSLQTIEDKPAKKKYLISPFLFKILIYIILIFLLGLAIGRAVAILN